MFDVLTMVCVTVVVDAVPIVFIPNWQLSVAIAVCGTPGEPLPIVHVAITGADDPGFDPGIAGVGLEVHVGFVPGKLIYTFERLCWTGDRIETGVWTWPLTQPLE